MHPLVQLETELRPCVYCLNCSNLTVLSVSENFQAKVMAAAASVSAAAREENPNAGPNFVSRQLHENYDPAVEHENWVSRDPEVEPSDGDAPSDNECQRRVEEELTTLSPEEIESRLDRTRREFYNRRKIIIKNLPSDVSNQVSFLNFILVFTSVRKLTRVSNFIRSSPGYNSLI